MKKFFTLLSVGLLLAGGAVLVLAVVVPLLRRSSGPAGAPGPGGDEEPERGPALTAFEDLNGCVFQPPPADPLRPPVFRSVPIPESPGSYAIWGATGRDARGHIYFGVCAAGVPNPSAHLFEYDPRRGALSDLGDVVSELRRGGLARDGEGQMKIHSKIVQAEDGHLYFASMDEEGEKVDGSRLPKWGGHLWRLWLPEKRWEHLLATTEALIAVAAAGRWVYALGYFDHVLYQCDCRTGRTRSVHVGSVGGHISRNFFADFRGHAFVPRLKRAPRGERMVTTLVEFDPDLREVAETPIDHYTQTDDDDSHGIVALQPLADRSIVFATDQGFLYRVAPGEGGPARVSEVGWFHPRGQAYVASLFTYDGKRHLLGLSRRPLHNEEHYEWLVFDLSTGSSVATAVRLPPDGGEPMRGLLLYGSVTRDDEGALYLAGLAEQSGRSRPVLLRATPP
jgi:hypothetical protein